MGVFVAPKDPEKQRSFFYIMREKEVFGSPQPDGKGVQFIYENDNRLINSARIVGNIDDESMLELLKTTEGFRKMVHSIGVSVEMDDPEDDVEFIFQMYGRTDMYGGGTNIKAELKGDGAETRIYMSEQAWSDDDKEPGQIRFTMSKKEKLGRASVRFYLNDGFTAPEAEQENPVDCGSDNYRKMVEQSLMWQGNPARLKRAIKKAENGEDVTLAFIGGSITQGAGATPIHLESYAYKFYDRFKQYASDADKIHLIKAGVGGTPSELGMLRFDRDVLRKEFDASTGKVAEGVKPDVIVIEFAVNDEGDETKGNCYESLVRKALSLPWKPAVILLFCVFANDYNLQDRLSPVGKKYDLPMVSIKDAVVPQFYDKESRVLTKNQFFYDIFHPANIGHTIMADCLKYISDKARELEDTEDNTDELLKQEPAIGADFEDVKLMDRLQKYEDGAAIEAGGFVLTDSVLQGVEMDDKLELVQEFPNNWKRDKEDERPFELDIRCKRLVLIYKDSGDLDVGKAEVWVDGKKVCVADPHINGWVHCNPVIILNDSETAEHHVKIRMVEEDADKTFTILGFGYVE